MTRLFLHDPLSIPQRLNVEKLIDRYQVIGDVVEASDCPVWVFSCWQHSAAMLQEATEGSPLKESVLSINSVLDDADRQGRFIRVRHKSSRVNIKATVGDIDIGWWEARMDARSGPLHLVKDTAQLIDCEDAPDFEWVFLPNTRGVFDNEAIWSAAFGHNIERGERITHINEGAKALHKVLRFIVATDGVAPA